MAKTIVQKVVFKNTTPQVLYNLYMNAKKHSMISGGPAVISTKEGTSYSVHGGYITGENLHLVKDNLIVQSWRTQEWDKNVPDSTLILSLEQKGKNAVLTAVHSNLPDKHTASIDKGWHEHYWNPWKQHIAGETITRTQM